MPDEIQKEKKKKKKKKVKTSEAEGSSKAVSKEAPERLFSRPELFTKPKDLQNLFQVFRQGEIMAEILRPRLQTESVEHGRGTAIVRNFSFRKFQDKPKAVLIINQPRSKPGGAFEPLDRIMKPGEQMNLTYNALLEGSERPIHFSAKGFFLRKSFYVAEDPNKPGKPWIGLREDAEKNLPKEVVVRGDEVIEVRIDAVNSFPGGPGKSDRKVLERYLSDAKLYILPSGAAWNQKSTQGNFFDSIRDPIKTFIDREDIRVLNVVLDEFANAGTVSVMVKERLLADVDHEVARPSVIKKPNDFLIEINSKIGFLLGFKMDQEIGESLLKTFPKKAGKDDEIFLPLFLKDVADAIEQFRVTFMVFPRDLIEEKSSKSMERGLKFQPPYALHQGSENQVTFSKLLILINQRFREDEKPDEEKLKSAKLQASVEKRISEQKWKFTDDKVASAFKERAAAKKRRDEGG
tara:strand:+ start:237 stop:1625 length:1389 start_codon:yes stop_codon:yes gene_type:complete